MLELDCNKNSSIVHLYISIYNPFFNSTEVLQQADLIISMVNHYNSDREEILIIPYM